MWEIVGTSVALLLAVYGVADLVLHLCWRLLFVGRPELITLKVKAGEDAEYHIRRLAMWARLSPRGAFVPAVELTEDNVSLKQLCERLGLICEITLQAPHGTL